LHVQANAAATIRYSSFADSDKGLYHAGSSNFVDIDSSCVFTGNSIGVHLYQTVYGANVRNSTINSNTSSGVVCDASHPVVQGNTIRYNNTAINCGNSATPLITQNVIMNSTNGIIVAFDAAPNIGIYPSTGGNTIAFSSSYHVRNYTGSTIYAQNNCWNMQIEDSTSCKPKASKIYGSVNTNYAVCCEANPSSSPAIAPLPTPERRPRTGLTAVVPNPFNPQTTIHYELASPGDLNLSVYDVTGRLVRSLVAGPKTAGTFQAVWDGTDRRGRPAASGIYFARLTVGGESFARKIVLLK
jgi:hypothetical protein